MSVIAGYMVPHPPIILPEVGKGEERKIAASSASYDAIGRAIAESDCDVILISTPHSIMYADYFHISPGKGARGNMGRFGAPEVTFEERYDEELAERVDLACEREGFPAGTLGEQTRELDHGTMIPLYYIRKYLKKDVPIVRIGLSGLSYEDHYRLGMILRRECDALGRRAVYVASGDLSHKQLAEGPYGYVPEGPDYDRRIMDVMGRGAFGELFDFDPAFCDKAAECGQRSFVIMAGFFDGEAVAAKALSHEATFGVGYGFVTFTPAGRDEGRHFLEEQMKKKQEEMAARRAGEDTYVAIARRMIETYIRTGSRLDAEEYNMMAEQDESAREELLFQRAGAFVSLHKDGQLRGCIGTFLPTCSSVAEEIAQNAISAAIRDPRFAPVREDELDEIEYSVDVLGTPERIDDISLLDVKRYGVIVSQGAKRGLLLPDLEGVDTVEAQIEIACAKANIPKGTTIDLERFEVVRHH